MKNIKLTYEQVTQLNTLVLNEIQCHREDLRSALDCVRDSEGMYEEADVAAITEDIQNLLNLQAVFGIPLDLDDCTVGTGMWGTSETEFDKLGGVQKEIP
tara:strand:- start:864 stop:1163 length:300 start_codon:yes stop_codon:yes gene_type:complete